MILKATGLLEMEKSGKSRLCGVTPSLKSQLAANPNVPQPKCCTSRSDKLPK
jgi:hypothetical protein